MRLGKVFLFSVLNHTTACAIVYCAPVLGEREGNFGSSGKEGAPLPPLLRIATPLIAGPNAPLKLDLRPASREAQTRRNCFFVGLGGVCRRRGQSCQIGSGFLAGSENMPSSWGRILGYPEQRRGWGTFLSRTE